MIPGQPPHLWPPLITAARLPRWMFVRDVALTILAWILLGWLLRDPIYLIYDFFRHPILELTTAQPPDWVMLWGRIRGFVILAASLAGALTLWAFVNRKPVTAGSNAPQPPALTVAQQAARFGVEQSAVESAREFRITSVNFREDGTVAGFEPGRAHGATRTSYQGMG